MNDYLVDRLRGDVEGLLELGWTDDDVRLVVEEALGHEVITDSDVPSIP